MLHASTELLTLSETIGLVYQSPTSSEPFEECDDWLFADNVATIGTPANTDQAAYIDAKIF